MQWIRSSLPRTHTASIMVAARLMLVLLLFAPTLATGIQSRASPSPSLYLGPCNATDKRMQWTGAALSAPGTVSAVENVGAKQCLSTLGKDPAVLEPCSGKGATWVYNSNLTLSVVNPSVGSPAGMRGVCVDIHAGTGPEIDLWDCHPLPPASCHADGVCPSDYQNQKLRYDASTKLLQAAKPALGCNAQCLMLGLTKPSCVPGQGGCDPAGSDVPRNGAEECSSSAPLILLPQDKGDESPACLDGSPYGLYHVQSRRNSTKWTIYLEGGGWCSDEGGCLARANSSLGSSRLFPKTHTCSCMNTVGTGLDPDCNCVYLKYGDGASFAGYRKKPWPVPVGTAGTSPGSKSFLTFRGIKNLDASVQWALDHGMSDATELVVGGSSAGGLSVFLHADRIAAAARKGAPALTQVTAAPDVGMFIDHDNFAHTIGVPNQNFSEANFTTQMLYIAQMQNMSFGNDGGLSPACKALHPSNPLLCFMAPYAAPTVQTPTFMLNSRFDQFQLGAILQLANFTTTRQKNAATEFGESFLSQVAPFLADSRHGAFITTCICHGCDWNDLEIDGKTGFQHYSLWMQSVGRPSKAGEHVHVDHRPPNGGGKLDAKCLTGSEGPWRVPW